MVIRIVAIVLAVVITLGVVCSVAFIGVKTAHYMIKQNFNFKDALTWSWEDYTKIIEKFIPFAKAESNEIDYNINKHIDVVPCTALQH